MLKERKYSYQLWTSLVKTLESMLLVDCRPLLINDKGDLSNDLLHDHEE